jgi:hypothetical protein
MPQCCAFKSACPRIEELGTQKKRRLQLASILLALLPKTQRDRLKVFRSIRKGVFLELIAMCHIMPCDLLLKGVKWKGKSAFLEVQSCIQE